MTGQVSDVGFKHTSFHASEMRLWHTHRLLPKAPLGRLERCASAPNGDLGFRSGPCLQATSGLLLSTLLPTPKCSDRTPALAQVPCHSHLCRPSLSGEVSPLEVISTSANPPESSPDISSHAGYSIGSSPSASHYRGGGGGGVGADIFW